ncbi:MAG: hypothetical protein ACNI26_15775 [Terasakiella sp.]|uniref:hypothetical protein n=1 Tax=unclassified Terasakiella TaxID=2614952 RepID=UPI003AFF9CAB
MRSTTKFVILFTALALLIIFVDRVFIVDVVNFVYENHKTTFFKLFYNFVPYLVENLTLVAQLMFVLSFVPVVWRQWKDRKFAGLLTTGIFGSIGFVITFTLFSEVYLGIYPQLSKFVIEHNHIGLSILLPMMFLLTMFGRLLTHEFVTQMNKSVDRESIKRRV